MTETELTALMQLLQRTPMSHPEGIWINQFLAKMSAEIQAKSAAAMQKTATEELVKKKASG